MAFPTVRFGSTGLKVARAAHGLLNMTARVDPLKDEVSFAAMKASLDLVAPGEKVVFNSAEFYGFNPREANLDMLNRFFTKHPEYSDRCLVAVKGSVNATLVPVLTPEFLRNSVTNCINHLGSAKKLDHFEPARLDPEIPVEETVGNLKKLVDEGLFQHIGLCEVSAETLRRACKVAPIASVEIEISPWAYGDEVKELIAAAKELNVSVFGYSPMGRGFLTGNISPETLGPNDFRRRLPRFQDEMMTQNRHIVDTITALAQKKGVTNAELCIAWVASLGDHVIPLPGCSSEKRTLENFSAVKIAFAPEEKKEMEETIAAFNIVGARYSPISEKFLMV